MLGPRDSPVVAGSLKAADEHGLPYEMLTVQDLQQRFPMFSPEPGTIGLLEREGGVLAPEACIEAHLQLAQARGAELHYEEPVLSWVPLREGAGVRVETSDGSYEAENLVLAAGAWNDSLVRDLNLPLQVVRKVMTWLRPPQSHDAFLPDRFPVWVWAPADGEIVYGFPAMEGSGGGIKMGIHSSGVSCDPDSSQTQATEEDLEALFTALGGRLPGLEGPALRTCTCFYTNTPDGHFILGNHPEHTQVILAAGFSGHGFKFAGLVGEVVSDLLSTGSTQHQVSFLSPDRFR